MARSYWLPDDEGGRLLWLTNFVAKLPTYSAAFGITAAEVTDLTNALAVFSFAINRKRAFQNYTAELVTYCKLLAGGRATDNIATFPTPPALGTVPPLVLAGMFKRVARIAARIKANLARFSRPPARPSCRWFLFCTPSARPRLGVRVACHRFGRPRPSAAVPPKRQLGTGIVWRAESPSEDCLG